jgi:hypothetical protein
LGDQGIGAQKGQPTAASHLKESLGIRRHDFPTSRIAPSG